MTPCPKFIEKIPGGLIAFLLITAVLQLILQTTQEEAESAKG